MALKLCLICIAFLYLGQTTKSTNFVESDWLKGLVTYITKNSQKHQVVLIIEDNDGAMNKKSQIEEIINEITKKTPSFRITFQEATNQTGRYPTLENDARATTLFILILVSNNESFSARLSEPLKFLTRLSKEKSLPKCLIIHLLTESGFTYKKFLQNSWAKRFLDMTVVEIKQNNAMQNLMILSPIRQQETAILHQFNPFNKVYTSEVYSAKAQWFPDKVRNLHGYKLKSVFLRQLNYQKVKPFMNTISKTMKFTTNLTEMETNIWRKFGCRKNETFGKLADLFEHKIQIIANPFFWTSSCGATAELQQVTLNFRSLHAIVPRIIIHKLTIVLTQKFIYTLVMIIFLVAAVHFIPCNCKFEKRFWQPMHILQIIVGMSVPEDPRKVKDRIIFGSSLITSFILSGYFFTILTEVGFDTGYEIKLDTLEDLDKSGLIPVFHPDGYKLIKIVENFHIQNLSKKAKFYSDNFTNVDCIKNALEFKNVSCIMPYEALENALQVIGNRRKELRVLDELVIYSTFAWLLEPGSPYFDRFQGIIHKLLENGMIAKWKFLNPSRVDWLKDQYFDFSEEDQSRKLLHQLLSIFLIGYLVAFIVFVGELIIGKISKKNRQRTR